MGRKKQGGTFQELQEQAQKGMAGGGNPMDQLANMDPDEMMKLIQEGMNDPATLQYMEQFGQGMAQVLEQLSSMDPEEMKRQITENLQQISSPDILNSVLEQQDEVLQSLLMQGLITEEQMLEFQNDPSKFQEQMAQAFDQMSKVLSDPQALDAAMQMMTGMAELMSNPEGAMKKLADAFDSELGDDAKIEEARLQLLADPSAAGNPAMAALFENEDMLEILKDPVKWRDQVRRGQEMLTGGGAGAGIGEL
jgi:monoamine oxidase